MSLAAVGFGGGTMAFGANDSKDRSWRWMRTAILSAITALICMPRGQSWGDTYPLHGPLGIALLLGLLLNAWSLDRMARRQHAGQRVVA